MMMMMMMVRGRVVLRVCSHRLNIYIFIDNGRTPSPPSCRSIRRGRTWSSRPPDPQCNLRYIYCCYCAHAPFAKRTTAPVLLSIHSIIINRSTGAERIGWLAMLLWSWFVLLTNTYCTYATYAMHRHLGACSMNATFRARAFTLRARVRMRRLF